MSDVNKAFAALRRPQGVTAVKLQALAGWARKPTHADLKSFAKRRNVTLTEHDGADGQPVYHFADKAARKPATRKEAAHGARKQVQA